MNTSNIDETLKVAPTTKPGKYKTILCRHYGTSRGCFKGDSCTFIHADPQPQEGTTDHPNLTSTSTEDNKAATTTAAGTPLCMSFKWKGTCRFGDSCKFSHNLSDGDKPQLPSSPFYDPTDDDQAPPEPSWEVKNETRPAGVSSNQRPPANLPNIGSRTITIYSQDEQQTWPLDVGEIAPRSEVLAAVFAYLGEGARGGTTDPCKSVRGLVRRRTGRDAFQLQDVEAADFDIFLNILRAPPDFEFPSDDFKVVLPLASDWGFDDLRRRAKCELDNNNLSTLDKLILARRCRDPEWIQEAYLALAIRIAPLSLEEIGILGVKTTAAITRARERVLIQRLRALPFRDSYQWRCRTSCRQALRDAWVKILEIGDAGEMVNLAVSAALLDALASGGTELCDECASDDALAKALDDRQAELAVAEAVIQLMLGKTAAEWMD